MCYLFQRLPSQLSVFLSGFIDYSGSVIQDITNLFNYVKIPFSFSHILKNIFQLYQNIIMSLDIFKISPIHTSIFPIFYIKISAVFVQKSINLTIKIFSMSYFGLPPILNIIFSDTFSPHTYICAYTNIWTLKLVIYVLTFLLKLDFLNIQYIMTIISSLSAPLRSSPFP